MSARFDILLETLKVVLTAYKRVYREMLAQAVTIATFNRVYPEYAEILDETLETARTSPVLQDKELAQFELILEKFSQTSHESLSDLELSALLEAVKQGLPN